MDLSQYKDVDGVWAHTVLPEEHLRSAMRYKPRPGDTFVVSYPKTGSIWTAHMVCNILTRAHIPENIADLMLMAPFMELTGAEVATRASRTGPILTHLPLKFLSFSDEAKYIYVTRNPYDCCVSSFYFYKGLTPKTSDASFEQCVKLFVSGKTIYGDYFDHLLPWYNIRHKPNVLFLTYEEMKRGTAHNVLKIADFLGEEHGKALRGDASLLRRIVDACSVQAMKHSLRYSLRDRVKALVDLPPEKALQSAGILAEFLKRKMPEMHEGAGFVRKGVVGDWRNHFSTEHIAAMKAWISEKTRNSDVMQLWKDLELPQ